MIKKLKRFIKNINNKYFYGKYKSSYDYMNKKTNIREYLLMFVFIFAISLSFLYLVFNNVLYSIIFSFAFTIFFINEIILNSKKLNYENYIISQLTLYTSQTSLLNSYNNVYSSLNEVVKFLDYPVKDDLEKVIKNIDDGMSMSDSFKEFNAKYDNRTITLFNQTLELFDEHGNSDAELVLQIISDEMNTLKIKKDKFFKYKKEWRLNFYIVTILSLVMPLILKFMIADIYHGFMDSFGLYVMSAILLINLFIIKKVELVFRNQEIGEKGYD